MSELIKEIWKETYLSKHHLVSNFGDVKSLERMVKRKGNKNTHIKGKVKTKMVSKDGYLTVHLCGDVNKIVSVHRLVAIAFIPNPENKPQVNHKDGNKQNNNVYNLEWMTQLENMQHSFMKLGRTAKVDHLISYAKKTQIPVVQLNEKGFLINKWASCTDAMKSLNIGVGAQSRIRLACLGKIDTAYGYKWKYATDYNKQVRC